MLALRAVADPTDELALVAALRSPLYGCSDVELLEWRRAGGRFRLHGAVPDGGGRATPSPRRIAHLESVARDVGRVDARRPARPPRRRAPVAGRRPRRGRRAATCGAGSGSSSTRPGRGPTPAVGACGATSGGRRTRPQEGRASDTILPERDHDAVRIMTVHAAKGLEFPITIVSGMTTEVQRRSGVSVVWPPGTWALAEKGSELFEEFKPDRRADGRRRAPAAAVRGVHPRRRPPRRVAAPQAARRQPGTGQPAELEPAGRVRRRRARRRGARRARRRRRAGAGRAARAAVARPGGVGRRARAGDGRRPGAVGHERHRARRRAGGGRRRRSAGGDGHRGRSLRRASVRTATPPIRGWPRTASTSISRRGSAVATARRSDGPCTPCCRTPISPRATTSRCWPPPSARRRASSGSSSGSPTCAARRSAPRSSPPRPAAPSTGASCSSSPSSASRCWRATSTCSCARRQGLVIVDYKTDQWRPGADQDGRIARYRRQLAAYGFALGRLLDEPIAGGVLVRCRPDGPADEIPLADWPQALADVAALGTVPTATV